jgi:hypothetical protein
MALVLGGSHVISRLKRASGRALAKSTRPDKSQLADAWELHLPALVYARQPGAASRIGVEPRGSFSPHREDRPERHDGPVVASEPYFPEGVFGRRTNAPVNDFTPKWYSGHLRAMGEPSFWELSRDDGEATGYRFLWLPTEGRPVAVRIMQRHEGAVLHLVQLDGAGGYAPGQVAVNKELLLSPEQWEGLSASIARARFWKMPARDGRAGFDGEELIVEGVRRGAYHVVDRWSTETGDFRRLCSHTIDLSGLDVGPSWYETRHVAPSLGKFALIFSSQVPLSGPVAIAIRFVRHTAKGDGGAVYEWVMQEDGSADFTRANVTVGRGEVYENYRRTVPVDRRGEPEIHWGPLTARWGPFGKDADCLYFFGPRPRAISITATEWTDLKAIDVHSPKLTWYHLAPTTMH